ncbi:MAG: type IV pilus modification protein PilV [Pseudomonadota bacterium]
MSKKTAMSKTRTGRREAGFGLVEILVAVLVLAIGVVGFAALQLRSMQTSSDSYARTQAMAIAMDLAERVRANSLDPAAVTAYRNDANWPPTNTTAVTAAPVNCMTGNCDSVTMATFDIDSARFSAATLLPQGLVRMEACRLSDKLCIYVSWDGLLPTSGALPDGQCVTAAGIYHNPPANRASLPCVMLEI